MIPFCKEKPGLSESGLHALWQTQTLGGQLPYSLSASEPPKPDPGSSGKGKQRASPLLLTKLQTKEGKLLCQSEYGMWDPRLAFQLLTIPGHKPSYYQGIEKAIILVLKPWRS